MSPRLLVVLPALFAASLASAQQYDPYGYPPPPPAYPQTAPGIPPLQGPVLAIPVLQADLKSKAGSETVRFGRESYVLTPQSQTTLDRAGAVADPSTHSSGRASRAMPTAGKPATMRWRSASAALPQSAII